MALVIAGRIAPCDREDPDAVFKGRVFIDDSGTIERVTRGNGPAPTGFAGAPSVDVGDNFLDDTTIRNPGATDEQLPSSTSSLFAQIQPAVSDRAL
jgi:hypothetical protein